ncbi:YcnI family protein [Conexibacter sp. CPCC 206217]|uniref:YcnI family protein n=1 Tax=Conexibacter sp. CPCC 206217 TaxID=3064574 RepID=UPI002727B9DE|nr:YcnI family protein [Conexibacter sp. CPCC 206217]MDO8213746.1 YcnI family protein [Conexibacter sp. CPCC 206217]
MNRTGPTAARCAPARLRTRRARAALAAGALLLAAFPAAARAHVTVVPRTAPAGAYTVLDVRVPNERDGKATTKVDVKLPPGFVAASFQPVPGWDVRVIRERLSRPIETENGPISEQVSRLVFSGGEIPPGAFQDFPVSVQIPDRPGETLTFKALQTYAGGEVVRWIGAPDSDTPAAQVAIVAADGAGEGEGAGAGHGGAAGGSSSGEAAASAAASSDAPVADPAPAATSDDGASKGLAYAGLAAGIVGLLLGAAALTIVTRRRSTPAA